MVKPSGYDNAKVQGSYVPVAEGTHKLVIKEVVETKTKTGKDMIVVKFDFDFDDVQPLYFQKEYQSDTRENKKWSFVATQYIVAVDKDNQCSSSLKTFVTCVENSNNGFKTSWDDRFAECFKGKRVGAVFGQVENEYNGKTFMRTELRWFCPLDKLSEQKTPEPKYLSGKRPQAPSTNDDFMALDLGDSDLPFN